MGILHGVANITIIIIMCVCMVCCVLLHYMRQDWEHCMVFHKHIMQRDGLEAALGFVALLRRVLPQLCFHCCFGGKNWLHCILQNYILNQIGFE